ncbi:MAG: hypothetical protein R3D00_15185 [Bacteroidia bacterium]
MANLNTKIYLIAFLSIWLANKASAQDILYMQGGNRLECLISDTQGGKVKYKMWQNRRGPDYVVPKERLLMLFYQDGRYTLFSSAFPDGMQQFEALTGTDRLILRDGSSISCRLERRTPESIIYLDQTENRLDIPLSSIVMIFFSDGQHELTGSAEQAAQILQNLGKNNPSPIEPPATPEPQIVEEPITVTTPEPEPEPVFEEPDPHTAEFEEAEEVEEVAEIPPVNESIPATEPPEETLTGATTDATPPDNTGYEIPAIDMKEYKAKALDRTRNLGQYFSIIADKATNWQDANDAIDLAVALFVGEEATVEVSSAGSADKKLYPIRQYLERLKLLKYERVDITWSDIVYVSELKKGVDGNYYGIISFVQKFTGYRDGQPVYSDYTRKNIEIVLKGYTKQVGGQTKELWDVFLSDIGVVNTRRG